MRIKMFMLPALIAVLAVAGLFAFAFHSSAQTTQEAANGQGILLATNDAGDVVRRQFSFSARRQADGTAKGNAVLHNPAFTTANGQKYQLQVDIKCLKVVGNIAIMSGTTKRTNDPTLIDSVVFSVQDNGEPGRDKDKISRVFFFDGDPATMGSPFLCQGTQPDDLPLETIESGNIQVRGTTTAIP